jgi:hypothetical protein
MSWLSISWHSWEITGNRLGMMMFIISLSVSIVVYVWIYIYTYMCVYTLKLRNPSRVKYITLLWSIEILLDLLQDPSPPQKKRKNNLNRFPISSGCTIGKIKTYKNHLQHIPGASMITWSGSVPSMMFERWCWKLYRQIQDSEYVLSYKPPLMVDLSPYIFTLNPILITIVNHH